MIRHMITIRGKYEITIRAYLPFRLNRNDYLTAKFLFTDMQCAVIGMTKQESHDFVMGVGYRDFMDDDLDVWGDKWRVWTVTVGDMGELECDTLPERDSDYDTNVV